MSREKRIINVILDAIRELMRYIPQTHYLKILKVMKGQLFDREILADIFVWMAEEKTY